MNPLILSDGGTILSFCIIQLVLVYLWFTIRKQADLRTFQSRGLPGRADMDLLGRAAVVLASAETMPVR
ncbi:hypothetical protein AR543_08710 [Paenibacillus bovis]|uniref:Uncharacterized protein n=1 Tax=Paenibacillus bovis TaxID=1616788 RepID=A0A172ZEL2_9BACL|nr:hypothetical protein AR543_08710 [Paenibacillus bovis]